MICRKFPTILALVGMPLALSSQAQAITLFLETFDTDVVDAAAFEATYPAFTVGGDPAVSVSVSSGMAVMSNTGSGNLFSDARVAGIGGDVIYTLEVGASNSNGGYNVGLQIGENRIVFHPGFSGGGAFRVEGPNGFGNQDMGFVPANGTLHQLKVVQNADSGLFELTFTDGDVPTNIYTSSFTNPASVGASFGPTRSGPTAETGFYDNLRVEGIPEPSVFSLLGMSFSALVLRRRRRD
ncbi:PEP-CTERM sorting domain-containing protein [Verrucomicrobiaceae bacterium 227]